MGNTHHSGSIATREVTMTSRPQRPAVYTVYSSRYVNEMWNFDQNTLILTPEIEKQSM